MASQLRVDEIIASTGSSVAIGTAGGSVTLAGDFTVDTSKGLNVGTGATIFSPSSNVLTLGTNNAERVRIDSSGRVLVGTTTPGYADLDDLTISTSGNTGITIRSGTSSLGVIGFADGTSGNTQYRGVIQYSHSDDFMQFNTADAERLRITSAGNIGIGLTNPTQLLHLSSSFPNINLQRNNNATNPAGVINFLTSDGTLKWQVGTNSAVGTGFEINKANGSNNLFYINDSGDVKVTSGNLVIGTSGKGIDFSATSDAAGMTSELLDDYEEGTWTPSFTGLTGPTYATQDGSYTKIGNLIYCECRVKLSNTGTASGGALQITGFPYTSSNDIVSRHGAYSINYVGSITSENEGSFEASYLGTNSTVFSILGNGHTTKLNTILQNTTQIDLMIVYRTA